MVKAKVNRKLAGLGAELTSTGINKGYITCSKSKNNSLVQDTEGNNVLLPQESVNNDNNDALAGAVTTLSLFSPPTDNFNGWCYVLLYCIVIDSLLYLIEIQCCSGFGNSFPYSGFNHFKLRQCNFTTILYYGIYIQVHQVLSII